MPFSPSPHVVLFSFFFFSFIPLAPLVRSLTTVSRTDAMYRVTVIGM